MLFDRSKSPKSIRSKVPNRYNTNRNSFSHIHILFQKKKKERKEDVNQNKEQIKKKKKKKKKNTQGGGIYTTNKSMRKRNTS